VRRVKELEKEKEAWKKKAEEMKRIYAESLEVLVLRVRHELEKLYARRGEIDAKIREYRFILEEFGVKLPGKVPAKKAKKGKLLEVLRESGDFLHYKEVAARAGCSPVWASVFLSRMVRAGVVERHPQARGYYKWVG